MATDFIARLRAATFPTARRGGYDQRAVDIYLGELADWLETGGDDQTRVELVRREMERVGQRTGSILAAAQESAEKIVAEAREEAEDLRSETGSAATKARSEADSYSKQTRAAADQHVRATAEAAGRKADDLRAKAEAEAKEKVSQAEQRLRRADEDAKARTADVKREVAELLLARDAVLAKLEELTGGIRDIVDGPGAEEIELPEEIDAASAAAPETAGSSAGGSSAANGVGEHRALGPAPSAAASDRARVGHESPDGSSDEEDEETAETVPTPFEEDEETEELPPDEEPTRMFEADFDTEEHERARERELERRRRPGSREEPTEDSDYSDLL